MNMSVKKILAKAGIHATNHTIWWQGETKGNKRFILSRNISFATRELYDLEIAGTRKCTGIRLATVVYKLQEN